MLLFQPEEAVAPESDTAARMKWIAFILSLFSRLCKDCCVDGGAL